MPAASVASAPVNRTTNRTAASRTKKPTPTATKKAQPATNGAVNGGHPNMSPYTIMASRIANRVAEMAENITFVERERYVRPLSTPQDVLAAVEHNGCATQRSDTDHHHPKIGLGLLSALNKLTLTRQTWSASIAAIAVPSSIKQVHSGQEATTQARDAASEQRRIAHQHNIQRAVP
jgi:hypothetical protein